MEMLLSLYHILQGVADDSLIVSIYFLSTFKVVIRPVDTAHNKSSYI